MSKDLLIIGASGFAKEVVWLVERINQVNPTWNLLGFVDKSCEEANSTLMGYPVISEQEADNRFSDVWYICAIGSAKIRKAAVSKYVGKRFATLIDPSVFISNRVIIGEGTIICAGTIVTVDISIGRHVIINLDCTVGHDAVLHDFVTVYPSVNISGNTDIGECVEMGTGMQIIQGKIIGNSSIVGAGAVVVKDIPEKCTAVGNPAKPIKFFN